MCVSGVVETHTQGGWRKPVTHEEFTSSLIGGILGLKTINRCFDSPRLNTAPSFSFTLQRRMWYGLRRIVPWQRPCVVCFTCFSVCLQFFFFFFCGQSIFKYFRLKPLYLARILIIFLVVLSHPHFWSLNHSVISANPPRMTHVYVEVTKPPVISGGNYVSCLSSRHYRAAIVCVRRTAGWTDEAAKHLTLTQKAAVRFLFPACRQHWFHFTIPKRN